MRISLTKRILPIAGVLGFVAIGSLGPTARAVDQTATMMAAQSSAALADERLRARVTRALGADPYFYGAHVTVSVHNGVVELDGVLPSELDLLSAVRIASKSVGRRRVQDHISIELGERNARWKPLTLNSASAVER